MFVKIILVILIVLFLLYLWNSYFEGVINDNDIIDIILDYRNDNPSFVTDSIFLPVAKILTLEDIPNGERNNLDGISSLRNLDISLKHTPIYYNDNDINDFKTTNNIRENSPSFEFSSLSSSPAIKINNVLYVDSLIDKYELYCEENDSNIIDLIKGENPLFHTRIAGFVKIDQSSNSKISGDIKDVSDKVILVKLKSNDTNTTTYDITYLEEGSVLSSENNYALYIYEGLDIEGPSKDGKVINTYKDFYYLKCSDIIYYFSKRRKGIDIQTGGGDYNNYPKYKYDKIINYIYYILLNGDRNEIDDENYINNKYLHFILGDSMNKPMFGESVADEAGAGSTNERDTGAEPEAVEESTQSENSISNLMLQFYYNIIKKNLILFHIQLSNISSGDFLLENITLDLNTRDTDGNYVFQRWRNLTPDRLSDILSSLYISKSNVSPYGGYSDNIIFNKQNIIRIDYTNESNDESNNEPETLKFLRIPDFTHLCDNASINTDVLREITLKKNNDSWIIENTNTCVDNKEIKVIKSKTKQQTLKYDTRLTGPRGERTDMFSVKTANTTKNLTFT